MVVVGEGEHTSANRVPRGLVPGLHQELAVRDELRFRQWLAVDLGADQLGHEIVLRIVAARFDHEPEVGVHLATRPPAGLVGRFAGKLVLGILPSDDLVGPAKQQWPVVPRHSEGRGDHRERKRRSNPIDEVELPGGVDRRGVVEDLECDAIDLGAPLA